MEEYTIIEPEISEYLAELSKEDLAEVIALYHNKENKIKDIIDQFNLRNINLGDFRLHLPPRICHDYVCPQCLVVSWECHASRGNYSIPYCPECNTFMYSLYDGEIVLSKRRREQEYINYMNRVDVNYYESKMFISNEEFVGFSYEKKVVLGCMASVSISEDLSHIKGKLLNNMKLFPEETNDTITFECINPPIGYLNEYQCGLEDPLGKDLIFPQKQLGGTLQEQFLLWKKINLAEAKELLFWRSNHMGFFVKDGALVEEVLSSLLSEYSVGQVYKIIWSAVSQATDYYSQTNNRFKSANSIIHSCRRSADYFKSRGWEIKNYYRPPACQQSQLSQYYFDTVLKIGDKGFNTPASLSLLIHNSINNKLTDDASAGFH
nr:hypothetical protein [uncultured Carboxylicivirga sp.]